LYKTVLKPTNKLSKAGTGKTSVKTSYNANTLPTFLIVPGAISPLTNPQKD